MSKKINREEIVDYLEKQYEKNKTFERMPENEDGYYYVPREALYKIVDGLIPMVKTYKKIKRCKKK